MVVSLAMTVGFPMIVGMLMGMAMGMIVGMRMRVCMGVFVIVIHRLTPFKKFLCGTGAGLCWPAGRQSLLVVVILMHSLESIAV
jgi:hypothetical protein